MNKKIFEIAGKNTSELAKLTLCWQEAQKELLEEMFKKHYSEETLDFADFYLYAENKLKELSLENNLK